MLAPEPAIRPLPEPASPCRTRPCAGSWPVPGRGAAEGKPACSAQLGEPEARGWVLRAGGLGEVVHARDGGLAEEAVLVVHQVLVDAGSGTGEKCEHPLPLSGAGSWGHGHAGATHLHDLWEQGLKMAEMGCA